MPLGLQSLLPPSLALVDVFSHPIKSKKIRKTTSRVKKVLEITNKLFPTMTLLLHPAIGLALAETCKEKRKNPCSQSCTHLLKKWFQLLMGAYRDHCLPGLVSWFYEQAKIKTTWTSPPQLQAAFHWNVKGKTGKKRRSTTSWRRPWSLAYTAIEETTLHVSEGKKINK